MTAGPWAQLWARLGGESEEMRQEQDGNTPLAGIWPVLLSVPRYFRDTFRYSLGWQWECFSSSTPGNCLSPLDVTPLLGPSAHWSCLALCPMTLTCCMATRLLPYDDLNLRTSVFQVCWSRYHVEFKTFFLRKMASSPGQITTFSLLQSSAERKTK